MQYTRDELKLIFTDTDLIKFKLRKINEELETLKPIMLKYPNIYSSCPDFESRVDLFNEVQNMLIPKVFEIMNLIENVEYELKMKNNFYGNNLK